MAANDPLWTDYMVSDTVFFNDVRQELCFDAEGLAPGMVHQISGKLNVDEMNHHRGFLTGSHLLNGANDNVGGLTYAGAVLPITVDDDILYVFDVVFVFNDLTDANPEVTSDIILENYAEALTLGEAQDFPTRIVFRSGILVERRSDYAQ